MGITFDGNDFETYGVIVDSVDTWAKPERDRSLIHVPGRNGDLIIDNGGYKNIEITYHCLIKDGWKTKFNDFVSLLYGLKGYHELDDDIHTEGYRVAEFAGPINSELIFATDTGEFDLKFNCKPQIYVPGSVHIMNFDTADAEVDLLNDYNMIAYPFITFDGANGGALMEIQIPTGGWTIEIAANNYDFIKIDCELETCTAYDSNDDPVADASNLLTITPTGTLLDRNYPYLDSGASHVFAFHEVWDYTDPDDPVLVATYTGEAEFNARFTRI